MATALTKPVALMLAYLALVPLRGWLMIAAILLMLAYLWVQIGKDDDRLFGPRHR